MKPIFAMLCAILLTGCASQTKHLPSIECRGKGTITGTGNVSVMMGSASNNFTIQADCGQESCANFNC